ncbi:MAG: GIY-YIG nuclease family protein [Algoriphagus sp.]|uniref:GIY-YIG nuclease family protein n=1 Tax=Algoriphagus sp. TaxID=1872435 RepID=UPI00272F2710|nr:GIY-YIG nuclease family protein [Algoriphagus sp.]MDP2040462.1 GIY-YIG nuclease family protein [Algoriphagus sp.]MDP3471819.1 GIY-YIG nuclease family protein [Algoriphagus sp.]
MKTSKSFQIRLKTLSQEDIENIQALNDESIKIKTGFQYFSLGCFYNPHEFKKYSLYYITEKYGPLEGCLLELNTKLTWKSRFSLVGEFALFLYQEYSVDSPIVVLNTFEAYQKNVFEKLNLDLKTNVIGNKFVHTPSKSTFINNKKTYIYLMKNNLNGLFKIGRSKQPFKREYTLQSQEPDIKMISIREATYEVETALHRKYKEKKVRGEWFNLTTKDIRDIEKFIINYKPNHWG